MLIFVFMKHPLPELLAPAGSLAKLKLAVSYGADAVYLSGRHFGLRAAGENFTNHEIKEAVHFARPRGVRIYVTLNGFLHDDDLRALPSFVDCLGRLGVDGVIVSDLGVLEVVKEQGELPLHLSTQASCLNADSAKLWEQLGVSRVILGREVSLDEAKRIKDKTGMEIEMFVHGSLCSAYSGHCVISNFTRGRDSNRGGCAHSCRFEYELDFKEGDSRPKRAFFMNSKDLQGLALLEKFIEAGVDSLKIEGRMKSAQFLGVVTKSYRAALDSYGEQGLLDKNLLASMERELAKVPSRKTTTVNLSGSKDGEGICHDGRGNGAYTLLGVVLEVNDQYMALEVKSRFFVGDRVELVPFKGDFVEFEVGFIRSFDNTPLEKTRPSSVVKIPPVKEARPRNIVRGIL